MSRDQRKTSVDVCQKLVFSGCAWQRMLHNSEKQFQDACSVESVRINVQAWVCNWLRTTCQLCQRPVQWIVQVGIDCGSTSFPEAAACSKIMDVQIGDAESCWSSRLLCIFWNMTCFRRVYA